MGNKRGPPGYRRVVHQLPRKETSVSKVLQRKTAILAVIASLVFAKAALAQMPPSPWKKAAPFPERDEELYGVAVNGKLYVIGGWGGGKARGANTSTWYTTCTATSQDRWAAGADCIVGSAACRQRPSKASRISSRCGLGSRQPSRRDPGGQP
jgi:hypothetical protein